MPETILFLGATGGVTNAILVNTLQHASANTTHCVALARTPSKLREMLEAQNLSPEQLSPSRLTILEGDALDTAALKKALLYQPSSNTTNSSDTKSPPRLPAAIISGLGGTPSLTFNTCAPMEIVTLTNPHICEEAAKALVSALREVYSSTTQPLSKPRLIFVSTTGISNGPEDVPLAMRFLYHRTLAVPHRDKRCMEDVFRGAAKGDDDGVFQSVTGIRPTLLSGGTGKDAVGSGKGWETVRAGREAEPAVGYSIARVDVGEWVWWKVLRGFVVDGDGAVEEKGLEEERWEGEMVSLTS